VPGRRAFGRAGRAPSPARRRGRRPDHGRLLRGRARRAHLRRAAGDAAGDGGAAAPGDGRGSRGGRRRLAPARPLRLVHQEQGAVDLAAARALAGGEPVRHQRREAVRAGDGRARARSGAGRIRTRGRARARGGLRRGRAAPRPRLSPVAVPLAGDEPAHGPLGRKPREPRAALTRSAALRARGARIRHADPVQGEPARRLPRRARARRLRSPAAHRSTCSAAAVRSPR